MINYKNIHFKNEKLFESFNYAFLNDSLILENLYKNTDEGLNDLNPHFSSMIDLEEKLNQAEKLRVLGELSSGIAHDFNNNLMVIGGASELLKLSQLTIKQLEYVEKILLAEKRSADLIRKILTFSKESSEDSYVDLVSLVKEVNDIINYTALKKVSLHFITGLKDAYVYGSRAMISNAIINLVKNAIEASDDNCDIYISLSLVYVDMKPQNSIYYNNKIGDYYKLDIKDFGCGISEDKIVEIFKPFYSTKDSNGTGLGLVNVLNLVKDMDGILTLKSTIKIGSVFSLFFRKN